MRNSQTFPSREMLKNIKEYKRKMRDLGEFPILSYPEAIQEEPRIPESILSPKVILDIPLPKRMKIETPSILNRVKMVSDTPKEFVKSIYNKSPIKSGDFGMIMSQQEKDESPIFVKGVFVDDDLDLIEIQVKLRSDVEKKQLQSKRF
jgi:hypothetical protein